MEEMVKQMDKEKKTIKIFVINDIPYIWDASDYIRLRRDHRIFGALDGGSLKNLSKSRVAQSLPVRLSQIEAHYLVKHEIARAFQIPALNQLKPEVPVEKVEELKKQRREEQLEIHRKKRKMEIESMVDKIIEGKRRKGRGLVPDKNTVIQEEIQKVGLPFETTQIDIVDPWITESDFVSCDVELPDTSLAKLRYMVFEDFHLRRKYYLGAGLKFGGDFLAYPGDPNDTHSEFIIVCHDNSRSEKPPYINSQIRLANTVKKTLLLALLDDKKNSVKYKVMNSLKLRNKNKM